MGVRRDVTDKQIQSAFSKFGKIETVSSKEMLNKFKPGEYFLQVYVNFSSIEAVQKTFYQGKQDEEIKALFLADFVRNGNFISLYQTKKGRNQYNDTKNSMKQNIMNSQGNQMNQPIPPYFQVNFFLPMDQQQ